MALTKVTGQVIKNTTDVTVGVLTVTNTLAVGGTVSIGGTLTYEDVTNVDAVGLITARNGIVVGSGITLSKDGDVFATGVTTATGLVIDSGTLNTCATFQSSDSGAVINLTDNSARSSIEQNGTDLKIISDTDAGDDNSTIKFQVDGGTKATINSGGDMGLGTSTIEDFGGGHTTLEVAGTTTSQGGVFKTATSDSAGTGSSGTEMIMFTDNTKGAINVVSSDPLTFLTANTERLRITSDGKIGIGEDDPDGNYLLIRAASTFQTAKGHIMLTGDSATVGQGPQIVFSESGSGSNSAGAYVGHVRTGSNSIGDLVFGTRATSGDANTVPTERLRIYANGAVLIGADSGEAGGDAKLAIDCQGMNIYDGVGDASNYGLIFANDPTGDKANGIGFFNDSASTCGGYIVHQDKGGGNIGDLVFGTSASSDTPVERFRIDSTGAIIKQQFTATNTYSANDTTQCGYQAQNLSDTTNTYAALRLTAGSSSPATAQIASIRTGSGQNDLAFQLESSNTAFEALRITSGGKIGINIADNTVADLQVRTGTNGNGVFRLGGSSSNAIGMDMTYSNSGATSTIFKQNYLSTNAGALMQFDSGFITFRTGTSPTERVRILASGGLTFNGDTAAANALDDYEEGNWTPAVKNGGGTITTIHSAKYTKVGRLVHIQTYFSYTTANNSGAFQIQGLPFNNTSEAYSAQVVDFGRGGKKGAYSRIHPNAAYSEFLYSSENTGADRITIKGNNIGSGYIIFSNTYQST